MAPLTKVSLMWFNKGYTDSFAFERHPNKSVTVKSLTKPESPFPTVPLSHARFYIFYHYTYMKLPVPLFEISNLEMSGPVNSGSS